MKVVNKISFNRGADLLACLVGARVGIRDCEAGLARTAEIAQGFGVPGTGFNNFDGAGSDDRNKHVPTTLNALNKAATSQPWGALYRQDLPQLGVPGGGDIATFGQTSPVRGKLQAKTGTRAGGAPGAPAGLLISRGLSRLPHGRQRPRVPDHGDGQQRRPSARSTRSSTSSTTR